MASIINRQTHSSVTDRIAAQNNQAAGEKKDTKHSQATQGTEQAGSLSTTPAPLTKDGFSVGGDAPTVAEVGNGAQAAPIEDANVAREVFATLAEAVQDGPPVPRDVRPSEAGDPSPETLQEQAFTVSQVFADLSKQLGKEMAKNDDKVLGGLHGLMANLLVATNGLTPPAPQTAKAALAQMLWTPGLLAALKPISSRLAAQTNPDVTLPGSEVQALERACQSPIALFGELSQGLENVSPKELQAAAEAATSGETEGVEPKLLDLVGRVSAFAKREGKPGEVSAAAGAIAQMPGLASKSGVFMEGMDIESLVMWVMGQAEQLESNILRDAMKDMMAINNKKKAQREKLQKMKEMQAKLESKMRVEFSELQASGEIHSSVTFEQFKAFRKVAWGDGQINDNGTWAGPAGELAPLPQPLPSWMVNGTAPTEGAGAGGVDQGFGLTDSQMNYFKQLYDALPAEKKSAYPDVNAWLKNDPDLKLKLPATTIDDAIANATKAKAYVDAHMPGGGNAENNAAVEELKSLMNGLPSEWVGNIQQMMQNLACQQMMLQLSPRVAGYDTMLANYEEYKPKLDRILSLAAQALPPADQAKLNAYVNETGPGTFADFMDRFHQQVGGMADYMKNIRDNAAEWASTYGESDNRVRVLDMYWSPAGVTVDYEWWEDGNDQNKNQHGKRIQTFGDGERDRQYTDGDDKNDTVGDNSLYIGDDRSYDVGPPPALDQDVRIMLLGQNRLSVDQLESLRNATAPSFSFTPGATDAGPTGPSQEAYDVAWGSSSEHTDMMALLNAAKNLPTNKLGQPYDDGSIAKDELAELVRRGLLKLGKTPDELAAQEKKAAQSKQEELRFEAERAGDATQALNHVGSLDELKAATDAAQMDLDSLSEMGNMQSLRLQQITERRSKLIDMMTNLMKKFSQTSDLITGNMK